MAVFSCFTATEDANSFLIIFGEVPKNDVNESKVLLIKECKFFSLRTRHLALRDAVRWAEH
jgi:hypothetical protein